MKQASKKRAPPTTKRSKADLQRENDALRHRLAEAEDTLRALQAGEADAVLVEAGGERVFTLESADTPYTLLVAQIPHAAATLGPDGTILSCNPRFADLLLEPSASIPGQSMHAFVAPASRRAFEDLLSDAVGAEVHTEILLQRADGGFAQAYLGVRALRVGVRGACLVLTDLTEQRRYEELRRTQEALRETESRLLEADRRKDEFLATLAHELRNPLAPMRNAVKILKAKGPLDPQLVWARDVLDRQTQGMTRLLEDLLDVSRISRDRLKLRTDRVDLVTVIEAALETSQPAIDAAGHQLTISLPAEPIRLTADPVRLAQVFSNLLQNAAKYTEPGGQIQLTAERGGAEVRVSVRDSGVGIPSEQLSQIFEIFSQAKPALVSAQSGLGIGLSLVKSLVELHGGSIEARSEGAGRGSEFVVRLPVASAAPAERTAAPSDDEQAATYRILIVDDNRDSADSLAMYLKIKGHDTRTAYDGEQALQAAEEIRPDVVLLDIGMPRLDGYEVCRRIRQQPWGSGMLVVALTGWGQVEDQRRTEEAGFDRHMVKPIEPAALMKLLASPPTRQGSQRSR
jgi:signal transduction histidine kinase/ActR/RegA family two-component response regulator